MKVLKKVNIGLILTIIVILAVTIYSICVENERKSAKADIVKSCEEFIDLTDKYYLLPSEYQVINQKGTDIDLTNYYTEMKNNLQNKTTTEQTAEIQKMILSEYVKQHLIDTSKITVDFRRDITKISGYSFDGNQVTVTFNSKVTIKQKYNDINMETGETSEKLREYSFTIEEESITLEKKEGIWKVVYANLQYQDVNTSMYYGM